MAGMPRVNRKRRCGQLMRKDSWSRDDAPLSSGPCLTTRRYRDCGAVQVSRESEWAGL